MISSKILSTEYGAKNISNFKVLSHNFDKSDETQCFGRTRNAKEWGVLNILFYLVEKGS